MIWELKKMSKDLGSSLAKRSGLYIKRTKIWHVMWLTEKILTLKKFTHTYSKYNERVLKSRQHEGKMLYWSKSTFYSMSPVLM